MTRTNLLAHLLRALRTAHYAEQHDVDTAEAQGRLAEHAYREALLLRDELYNVGAVVEDLRAEEFEIVVRALEVDAELHAMLHARERRRQRQPVARTHARAASTQTEGVEQIVSVVTWLADRLTTWRHDSVPRESLNKSEVP